MLRGAVRAVGHTLCIPSIYHYGTILIKEYKRRFRTYSRRVTNTLSGGLRHPCFFMHVPKCGGTSVSEALYATVPMHRRIGIIDAIATRRATALLHANSNEEFLYHDDLPTGAEVYDLREKLLLVHMAWKTELIHGHVLFSEKAYQHFGDKYRYVTLLREPVERTVSNFLGSVRVGMIANDLDRYLESGIFRSQGLSMLRYFSGMHPLQASDEKAALERAKFNLTLFSVVGFLDDLDGFAERFAAVCGRRPVIYRYNRSHVDHPSLNATQTARLESVLAPELELWEYARELYGR